MKVELKWHKPAEETVRSLGVGDKLQYFTAYTLYRHMDKYVPMDTGMLAQTVDIESNPIQHNATITYLQEYGKYVYFNPSLNFIGQYHPLATAYWDEVCWNNEKDKITREIDTFRKRVAT